MYQALYRKYRPQTFDEVVGQNAVTQTLKNQIVTGKLGHAYLFTGSWGTGKTTLAKILAKAANCQDPQNGNPCNRCAACRAIDSGACMDVQEIDAASNNGVDNVRDLRDDAIYAPAQVRKRVYIIDEVHMLSISAFNALLKILEEPPEHLLFILATTELHKVPATILSRCQRFSLRRISQEDIAARLQYVAYQEDIDLDHSAARVIARMADGGMRDALSLLDQCASATAGELNEAQVYACLGIAGTQTCEQLMRAIGTHDTAAALGLLNRFYSEGKDMAAVLDELMCLARDLLILKAAPKEGISMLSGVASERETQSLNELFSTGELTRMIALLAQTVSGFTRSGGSRVDAEVCLARLCMPELVLDAEALNARLTRVEAAVRNGVRVAAPKIAEQTPAQPEPVEEAPQTPPEPESLPELPEFWGDLVSALHKALPPSAAGYFGIAQDAMVRGALKDGKLTLLCKDSFVHDMVKRGPVLAAVTREAGALLGAPVTVEVCDLSARPASNPRMDALLNFGRAHSDVIKIKE